MPKKEESLNLNNPVEFFTLVTRTLPDPWQMEVLNDNKNRICIRAGRQTGKSTVIAVKAFHMALTKPSQTIIIVSRSLPQSRLMFEKVERLIDDNQWTKSFVTDRTKTRIRFDNKSEIYALPAGEGESIRGYTADVVILDEAAFIKERVFQAVEPMMASKGPNGMLIMVSTPWGKQGQFYEAFESDQFSKYHIPWQVCPRISEEFIDGQRSRKTENEIKQEYEAEFIEESDTFFPLSLVKLCASTEIDTEYTATEGYNYYLGVDQARYGNDETVYVVVREKDNNAVAVLIESTSKKPVTEVIGRVQNLHSAFDFKSIHMDETGLGAGATDVLLDQGLPLRSMDRGDRSGVSFTLKNKSDMYRNLKLLMEQKKLRYPYHEKLLRQMGDLQYTVTAAGLLNIHHPNRTNAHDDYTDALALACWSIHAEKRRQIGFTLKVGEMNRPSIPLNMPDTHVPSGPNI